MNTESEEKRIHLYKVWCSIKTRCYNEKRLDYKYYGGKGVKISPEWKNNFLNFYSDMSDFYESGFEIDRIDVNGDYCKSNCRWVSHKENSNNRSNCVIIEHNGESKTLAEWAEIYNINYHLLYKRLNRGYTFEDAITNTKRVTKIPSSLQHLTLVILSPLVKTHSISEIAKMFGVNRTSLKARIDSLGITYNPKKSGESTNKIKFNCPYYPCHTTIESCEYCYCPLFFDESCVGIQNGDGFILENGVKDCSNCTFNHEIKNFSSFIK